MPSAGSELLETLERVLVPFAAATGVGLTPESVRRLADYGAYLLEANERMNLTACHDAEELAGRHLADAVRFAGHVPAGTARLVDIGSGGGLPGLALAILRPQMRVTLIESVRKKALFLESAVERLELTNLRVVCARAEDVGRVPGERASYAVATARACASLSIASEYALPLLTVGGVLLSPKGPSVEQEIAGAGRALESLGGRLLGTARYALPGCEATFWMIRVEKIRATSERYPRSAAQMARRAI